MGARGLLRELKGTENPRWRTNQRAALWSGNQHVTAATFHFQPITVLSKSTILDFRPITAQFQYDWRSTYFRPPQFFFRVQKLVEESIVQELLLIGRKSNMVNQKFGSFMNANLHGCVWMLSYPYNIILWLRIMVLFDFLFHFFRRLTPRRNPLSQNANYKITASMSFLCL